MGGTRSNATVGGRIVTLPANRPPTPFRGTLPRSLEPFRDRIEDFTDERDDEGGYWVYLMKEWENPDFGQSLHEDTIGVLVKRLRESRRRS